MALSASIYQACFPSLLSSPIDMTPTVNVESISTQRSDDNHSTASSRPVFSNLHSYISRLKHTRNTTSSSASTLQPSSILQASSSETPSTADPVRKHLEKLVQELYPDRNPSDFTFTYHSDTEDHQRVSEHVFNRLSRRSSVCHLPTVAETDQLESSDSEISDSTTVRNSSSSKERREKWDLKYLNIFYNKEILQRRLIQTHLKNLTGFECIPQIIACQLGRGIPIPLDDESSETYVTFLIEEAPKGGVPVRTLGSSSPNGSDQIEIQVDGNWVRLSGSKKKQFLEDLASIQVSYSMFTATSLGPVEITSTNKGLFPPFKLDPHFGFLSADVVPESSSARDYFHSRCLSETRTQLWLTALKTIGKLKFVDGPYPLSPPTPIWPNLLVDPATGHITHLANSHKTSAVPWELAAQAPLHLSSRSQHRYKLSMNKQYWACLIRGPQYLTNRWGDVNEPRLDQVAFSLETKIVECILRINEVETKKQGEELERRIKVLVDEMYQRRMLMD